MTDKDEISHVSIAGVSMYHVPLVDGYGKPSGAMQHASITLNWAGSRGFGEVTIVDRGPKKGIEIDSECMSKETLKAIFCKLVDDAKERDWPKCTLCKSCRTSLRAGGWYCPECAPKADDEPVDVEYERREANLLNLLEKSVGKAHQLVGGLSSDGSTDSDDLIHFVEELATEGSKLALTPEYYGIYDASNDDAD